MLVVEKNLKTGRAVDGTENVGSDPAPQESKGANERSKRDYERLPTPAVLSEEYDRKTPTVILLLPKERAEPSGKSYRDGQEQIRHPTEGSLAVDRFAQLVLRWKDLIMKGNKTRLMKS